MIGCFPSFAVPVRWSLLKKGIDPFCGIFQKHIARHDLAGDVIGCPEEMIDLAVERMLAEADRGGTPAYSSWTLDKTLEVMVSFAENRSSEPE